MKQTTLLAAIALSASMAQAQIAPILLEACNAINDSAKRMECLQAASATSAPPASAPSPFEPVRRAFTGLRSGLAVGTSYLDFRTSIRDATKELEVFKTTAAPKYATAIHLLELSLDSYNDAGQVWVTSIEFYSRRDNGLAYARGMPIAMTNIGNLVNKHNLPVIRADLLGLHDGINVAESRAAIFLKAEQLAKEGLRMLEEATSQK